MGGLLRLFSFLILTWLLVSGIRRLLRLLSLPRPDNRDELGQKNVPLVQDPQCGRFVPEDNTTTGVFHGRSVTFCSQDCLDRYTTAQAKKH